MFKYFIIFNLYKNNIVNVDINFTFDPDIKYSKAQVLNMNHLHILLLFKLNK